MRGFCISCGEGVALNPQKPYCPDCYKDYLDYEADSCYIGFYCHICCCESISVNSEQPVCYICAERMEKEFKASVAK